MKKNVFGFLLLGIIIIFLGIGIFNNYFSSPPSLGTYEIGEITHQGNLEVVFLWEEYPGGKYRILDHHNIDSKGRFFQEDKVK